VNGDEVGVGVGVTPGTITSTLYALLQAGLELTTIIRVGVGSRA
jgi:hypothetical protein